MAVQAPAHLDWSKTAPVAATVPALLAWGAATHGQRDVLVIDDERLTYAELDTRSAAFAAHLLAAGVGRGTRVGLLLPNGAAFVVSFFALARIGAVPIPVSTLSSPPELARISRSAGFALLIATDAYLGTDFLARISAMLGDGARGPAIAQPEVPHLRAIWLWHGTAAWATTIVESPAPPAAAACVTAAEALVTPADMLTIIYTSGSTSEPKGVIHSHGTFMRSSRRWAASMPYRDGDRLFGASPMFWVGGLVTSLMTLMQVGGALVSSARSGAALLDVIERERCTTLQVWPHMARQIAEDPSFAGRDWSAMRIGTVLDMIPPERHQRNPNGFGWAMGMTETSGPHSLAMAEIDDDHRGAMGLLAPGMEHRIVDPETGELLGEGEPGELHVRGDTLMLGYAGRERTDTFDADGWFATGDICSIRDAHLFFHGRRDAMIKTAGANVAPAEVEAALLTLPGVAEAHVLGIADPVRGQVVGALLVPHADVTLERDAVLAAAKPLLSSYKVPRKLVIAAAAPATGTNKLDRRAAARMIEELG
ncbi:class I adenylate-forming enzyme family protein [Sphingomonas immobilis]|uniref:Class I adenylate-forming enzyme family protein n=1 Tax=Sphingomonas immobilis TaxID=3063997 RepID=A0ABT8ZXP4_9SPHN|nr:class I adenylate-forming enzyme family protein [Sphingomonas sp. CA1-15]MDO7842323.1 class I adenylate-forming enzyme family protein [Sphingomonas sp. CA1-15]